MKNKERLQEIFAQALKKKSRTEQERFLAEACQGDAELREQVESLLHAHEQAGNFLKQTIQLPATDFVTERTGTMIGRYKLLQKIGEGGFGAVWMAEQEEPVRRRVALKIIKAGMDTHEVVARFEAERQALALMDHPNIARVFDAGTTQAGRPYFVMELVNGIPITDYCDRERLSTAERLQLFMKVCHAVQHAHQKGIIHRDLKPNNVLVTLHDGEPVPKVIDFGVAKALGQKLTEKTLFTAFKDMIGTPAYMSPEQAELSGLDIDTRSDIYSLGVLLYELLTGETPFNSETWGRAALDEIRRIIRETEPPKPSTRLQTLGDKLTEVAKRRHTEPLALRRLVRGDLDWIVMKALEKDRKRRYETPDAFASDVARHLNTEPVIAAAPSALYLTGKFIRRHRAALATASALAVLLLAGSVVSTWQALRAGRFAREADGQRRFATNEAARALRFADESERARNQSEINAYGSRILLAEQLWQSGAVEDADKSLDECAASLRDWEWNQLKRQFHGEILSIPPALPVPKEEPEFGEGHLTFIRKDTELWVSRARHDGACYSVTNGVPLSVNTNWLPGLPTSDGRWLVSQAKPDSPAAVIDVASGRVLTTLQAAPGTAVALSPDQSLTASWAENLPHATEQISQLLISSSANGQLLQQISMPDVGQGLLWSPDSRWLLAGGRETSRLVEARSGRVVFTFDHSIEFDSDFQGRQGAFSSDSKRFAWAWGKGPNWGKDESDAELCTLSVLDLSTERRLFEQGLRSIPSAVSFAEGDRTLVVASASVIVNVETAGEILDAGARDDLTFFDATSGKLKRSFRLELGVCPLLVSPSGERVAAGAKDGSVHLMEIAHPEPHKILRGHRKAIAALAFDAQGSRLASLDQSGEIKLWDVSPSVTPSLKLAAVDWGLPIRPDVRIENGRCVIWNESHCTRIADLDRHQCLALLDEGSALTFSPDGRWLVAGDEIWDLTRWVLLRRIPNGGERQKWRFSGDGQRAAILTNAGSYGPYRVQVVEITTGTNLGAPLATTWQTERWPATFALNHDGTLAVISDPNGLVRICRIATGADTAVSVCTFRGAPPYEFGPDSSWLLTGCTNGGFQQVEVSTGIIRRTFPGAKQVEGFEVSRSGRHVRIWKDQVLSKESPWGILDMLETRGEVWCLETGELLAAVPASVGDEAFVFNPSGTRMALPRPDGLLRIWDLGQRRVLMPLPVQALAWGWSPDGNKLTVVGRNLEIEEFDGSPWKAGEQKATKVPFQLLTRPQQTSVPGVQLVARLYRTTGGANASSVAVRPPVVYQSFGGSMILYQLPKDRDGERAAFIEGSDCADCAGLPAFADIVRRGEYLFATSSDAAFGVYRLGGVTNIPQRVTVTGPVNGHWGQRLVVANNIVCVLCEYIGASSHIPEIHIYDVAEPESPMEKGSFRPALPSGSGCLIGPRLYLGQWSDGKNLIQAVDIRDPKHPVFLGQLTVPGRPYELLNAGSERLVALLGGSAVLIDIIDPARLKMIGEPLQVPALTGAIMPWGDRRLLITGEAAVSIAEDGLKLEGWLPGRGERQGATSEGDLAIIPSYYGAYVFRVRPPP